MHRCTAVTIFLPTKTMPKPLGLTPVILMVSTWRSRPSARVANGKIEETRSLSPSLTLKWPAMWSLAPAAASLNIPGRLKTGHLIRSGGRRVRAAKVVHRARIVIFWWERLEHDMAFGGKTAFRYAKLASHSFRL